MKRRIEIIAFERERIVRRSVAMCCPVCRLKTELLTARQAGALLQVGRRSIYRWLAQGKIHGIRTPGGSHRVCRESLFVSRSETGPAQIVDLVQSSGG